MAAISGPSHCTARAARRRSQGPSLFSLEALGSDAEEWECIQSTSSWADTSLETIERILGSFGNAVSIARSSMMPDFIPYG